MKGLPELFCSAGVRNWPMAESIPAGRQGCLLGQRGQQGTADRPPITPRKHFPAAVPVSIGCN
jgi:hypothetical protein